MKGVWMLAAMGMLGAAREACAQYLMVVDWSGPRIHLLDAFDGHVVNHNYIQPLPGGASSFLSPIEAIQVGNEIWVSNQTGDNIQRFSAEQTPRHLGTIGGFLDNIRGMCRAGNFVYVCNDGGAGTATPDTIYKLDLEGNYAGEFTCPDPWAVMPYGSGLISSGSDGFLRRFDLDGANPAVFYQGGGATGAMTNARQMCADADGGVWVVSNTPAMILKFDQNGAEVYRKTLAGGSGPRGIARLGNGKIIFSMVPSAAGGVYTLDPVSGEVAQVFLGSQNVQFISPLTWAPVSTGCQPADIANDQGTALNDPDRDLLVPNGGVNEGDYNCFFTGFFDASGACDIADDQAVALPPFGTGGTGGVPNGGVNEGDFNCFFQRFFDGCP